jgi:hypothetical protein
MDIHPADDCRSAQSRMVSMRDKSPFAFRMAVITSAGWRCAGNRHISGGEVMDG